MFDYFKRRKVVEVVDKDKNESVFGKIDSVGEWRKRGEYYLQNAEGERRKGCLRLAAKCFDKAGDTKKRDYALAYLSFEEQDFSMIKKQSKQGVEQRHQLYTITAQLLEAKDVNFLGKAALCLLKSGDENYLCAKIFETYALLQFNKRTSKLGLDNMSISNHEQEYFSYAGKLFERCLNNRKLESTKKYQLIISSFQNYARSGSVPNLQSASKLIEENSHYLKNYFVEIHSLCSPTKTNINDPIALFHSKFHSNHEDCQCVVKSIGFLANISCRVLHSNKDSDSLSIAISSIPSRKDRIRVLSSLDNDVKVIVSNTPWASHPAFSDAVAVKSLSKARLDITEILVKEMVEIGQQSRVVDILEERGFLIEAASAYDLSVKENLPKIAELQIRFIELIIESHQCNEYCSQLQNLLTNLNKSCNSIPHHVKLRTCIANAKISGEVKDMWHALETCNKSILLKYTCAMMIIRSIGIEDFLKKIPNGDFWHRTLFILCIARDMQYAASTLCRSSENRIENSSQITQIEAYFELESNLFDPNQLRTNCVTNLRLREALLAEKELLPTPTSISPTKLTLPVDKKKIHGIIANYLRQKSISLISMLEKCLSEFAKRVQPCLTWKYKGKCKIGSKCEFSHFSPRSKSLSEQNIVLQSYLLCLDDMAKYQKNAKNKIDYNLKKHRIEVSVALTSHLLHTNMDFNVIEEEVIIHPNSSCIAWRQPVLKLLASHADSHWYKLSLRDKKECLHETINYWRVLNIYGKSSDNAAKIMYNKIRYIEQHISTKNDWQNNRRDHFIKKKRNQIFTRMWVLATSIIRDGGLFESIKIVEDLLKIAKKVNERVDTLTMPDQIALLEVNTVSVLGALSLRYSEVKETQKCVLIIPERCYLRSFLDGNIENCGSRGFGVAIKGHLSEACHKDFFECFNKVVAHIEFIAGFIVESKLLSLPDVDARSHEIARYERAIVLSSFLCYNAVAFFNSGADIGPEDQSAEPNKLPKLPLNGNIRVLVKTLRESIIQNSATILSETLGKYLNEKSTFFDLLQGINSFLCEYEGDQIVLCFLKECEGDVNVITSIVIDDMRNSLGKIPFDESHDLFVTKDYKSSLFLKTNVKHGVDNSDESNISINKEEFSRIVDEKNAALTITRNLVLHQTKNIKKKSKKNPITYFSSWKETMQTFVKIIRKRIRSRTSLVKNIASKGTHSDNFIDIPDLWHDQNHINDMFYK